jgi:hypothetical protein
MRCAPVAGTPSRGWKTIVLNSMTRCASASSYVVSTQNKEGCHNPSYPLGIHALPSPEP